MMQWFHQFGIDASTSLLRPRQIHQVVGPLIRSRWAKIILVAGCLVPLAVLIWQAGNGKAVPRATEIFTRETGDWALTLLILTLAITPLRRFLSLPDLIRFRRTLGLFAFFYGCLHIAAWRVFKLGHAPQIGSVAIWSLRVGVLGFVLMIPLAVTSTDRWIRWLGGRRWRALHSLAYPITIIGVVHYYGFARQDVRMSVAYGAIVILLLLFRIRRIREKFRTRTISAGDSSKIL
jgi:sulfoxide reductase heme-binding subunit YedZ